MRLLNVRLTDADAHIVKSLRKDGVAISDLVRQSLRAAYQRRRTRRLKAGDVRKILDGIRAAYPTPPGLPRPKVNPLDRRAVRQYIAAKVRREASQ